MASKLHCDVCDGTNDPKPAASETVRLITPNNCVYQIVLKIDFEPMYRDEDQPRKDLCMSCRRRAFEALAVRYGATIFIPCSKTRSVGGGCHGYEDTQCVLAESHQGECEFR